MRVSQVCLFGLVAPVVTWAFLPQSLKNNAIQISSPVRTSWRSQNVVGGASSWSQDDQCTFTQLNMAFKDDEPSNIFDGPMALTKERDACGVGFIANTKEGGKISFYNHLGKGEDM